MFDGCDNAIIRCHLVVGEHGKRPQGLPAKTRHVSVTRRRWGARAPSLMSRSNQAKLGHYTATRRGISAIMCTRTQSLPSWYAGKNVYMKGHTETKNTTIHT